MKTFHNLIVLLIPTEVLIRVATKYLNTKLWINKNLVRGVDSDMSENWQKKDQNKSPKIAQLHLRVLM